MPIKVQGGKLYYQVAERLALKEKLYPDTTVRTSVKYMDGKQVIMRAEIRNKHGKAVSTGHAHARFGRDQFTDKVLEKAESCAVGRALAFLDTKLRGDEIASADEIVAAIEGAKYQEEMTEEHAHAIFALLDDVNVDENTGVDAFAEAWLELNQDEQMAISPHIKNYYPGGVSAIKEKMRSTMRSYREGKAA